MKDKTKISQKRIILIVVLLISLFLIFYFAVYSPIGNRIKTIKQELSEIEKQIQGIESVINKDVKFEESIQLLEQEYKKLNSKFPQKEEEALKMLADTAAVSNIEIISIRAESKSPFLDAQGKKIEIEGKLCQKVLVSVDVKALYKDLINYFENVRKTLPVFVSMEKFRIFKSEKEASRVDVSLEIGFYLLT